MNPTPHIIPSALLLLAAFLIGCLIGFGAKRMFGPRRKAAAPGNAPARVSGDPVLGLLDAPLDGRPDDLKKIKGIGPKLELVLHENGVYHFRQIAAWNARSIAIMNERLSFRGRIEREKWVSQAKALAKTEPR